MKSTLKIIKNKVHKHTQTTKPVRKDWNEAFKQAIAKGDIPENDMFEGMKNTFDDSEW